MFKGCCQLRSKMSNIFHLPCISLVWSYTKLMLVHKINIFAFKKYCSDYFIIWDQIFRAQVMNFVQHMLFTYSYNYNHIPIFPFHCFEVKPFTTSPGKLQNWVKFLTYIPSPLLVAATNANGLQKSTTEYFRGGTTQKILLPKWSFEPLFTHDVAIEFNSTQGGVSYQIQHFVLPHALFVTYSYP